MSALRWRTRALLGLPAPGDAAALKQPRAVPWLAAPAAFVATLAVLTGLGLALETALNYRDGWQVNAPAIAGLTAILLLAPSSPTQPRARNAWAAAILGLAVVGAGYAVAVAWHTPGTSYSATALLTGTVAALAGCIAFTAVTRVRRWTLDTPVHSASPAGVDEDGRCGHGETDGEATTGAGAPSVDA